MKGFPGGSSPEVAGRTHILSFMGRKSIYIYSIYMYTVKPVKMNVL